VSVMGKELVMGWRNVPTMRRESVPSVSDTESTVTVESCASCAVSAVDIFDDRGI
jgi:hypothetical protein